ncbi:MAG: hypothetical protein HOC27_01925 [Phycisphaerae bacterium]|jgi:hypothetical protein|nr:hypothetical protein [Phycisphaerae bacterium]
MMTTTPVSSSLPLLLIVAALLPLLGVIPVIAIAIVARRRQSCRAKKTTEETAPIDAWEEAANRIEVDFDEPEQDNRVP